MNDAADATPLEWVEQACRTHGLDVAGIRLLAHYSNAVVLVPGADAVARVAIGHHNPEQIRRSQNVTRWLDQQHGFPTVVPLGDLDIVQITPHVTVSFWRYYPQPEGHPGFNSANLGQLLRRLHTIPAPPLPLAQFRPLTSLVDALADDTADILSADDRQWITDQIARVTDRLANRDWDLGTGLVHGDAWAGNLLTSTRGVALGDWDRVAHGPREIDLIPTWHAAHRYGRATDWISRFVTVYGYDLRDNPAFDDLLRMRDLAQLPGPLRRAPHSPPHAAALRQRLADLRADNTTGQWIAL
jgi:hypothetical protein